jgi:hypothetical protein
MRSGISIAGYGCASGIVGKDALNTMLQAAALPAQRSTTYMRQEQNHISLLDKVIGQA